MAAIVLCCQRNFRSTSKVVSSLPLTVFRCQLQLIWNSISRRKRETTWNSVNGMINILVWSSFFNIIHISYTFFPSEDVWYGSFWQTYMISEQEDVHRQRRFILRKNSTRQMVEKWTWHSCLFLGTYSICSANISLEIKGRIAFQESVLSDIFHFCLTGRFESVLQVCQTVIRVSCYKQKLGFFYNENFTIFSEISAI